MPTSLISSSHVRLTLTLIWRYLLSLCSAKASMFQQKWREAAVVQQTTGVSFKLYKHESLMDTAWARKVCTHGNKQS